MKGTLLLRGGKVVSEYGAWEADVLVSGGSIVSVCKYGVMGPGDADRVLDASGLLVMPGGIDPHVHISRKNNKSDDFYTGSCAALAGGTTSVIDFCEPDAGESAYACIADRKARGRESAVDYAFHFAFTEAYRDELKAIGHIVSEGLTSFKAFTCYENTTLDRGDLQHIFSAIRDIGPILVHGEAEDVCKKQMELLNGEDPLDFSNCAKARPILAEQLCAMDLAALAEHTGARVCMAHLSSALGLQACRGKLQIETCPHYLAFTEDCLKGTEGALYTMTPALRPASGLETLWMGLINGEIGMLATDHCAFPMELKRNCTDWRKVPNGVGGIQQRMHYLYSEGVVKRGMPLERYVALTSANAARFYGLWPRKGRIAVGSDADIILLDPGCCWRFERGDIAGAEDHSLYEGMEFTGRIRTVISRGEVAFEDNALCAPKGRGEYLHRSVDRC